MRVQHDGEPFADGLSFVPSQGRKAVARNEVATRRISRPSLNHFSVAAVAIGPLFSATISQWQILAATNRRPSNLRLQGQLFGLIH